MPIPGPTDTVPALLTPGEHVINREAVQLLGADNIVKANQAGLRIRNGANPVDKQFTAGNTLVTRTGNSYTGTPIAPASQVGGAEGSAAAINKPLEIGVPKLDSGIRRVGNSYSAANTGVNSVAGSVTQPVTTGIMRGMPTRNTRGFVENFNSMQAPSETKLPEISTSLGGSNTESSIQGYADGTLDEAGVKSGKINTTIEANPTLKETLLKAKYPEATKPLAPNITHGFEGDPGARITRTGGVNANVTDYTPSAKEVLESQLGPKDAPVGATTKPGISKLAEAEKAAISKPYIPFEETKGLTTKVRDFTPTPQEVAASQLSPKDLAAPIENTAVKESIERATGVSKPAVSGNVERMLGTKEAFSKLPPEAAAPSGYETAQLEREAAAKAAGAERVKAAKAAVENAKPIEPIVNDTTIPKPAKAFGEMGLATGLASDIIQNPMIAQQTNAALRRKGLRGIVPTTAANGEMPVTQLGRWIGGKAYGDTYPKNITEPTQVAVKKETVKEEQPQQTASQQRMAEEPEANRELTMETATKQPGGVTFAGAEQQAVPKTLADVQAGQGMVMDAAGNRVVGTKTGIYKYDPTGKLVSQRPYDKPATQSEAAQKAGTTDFWYNRGYTGGAKEYLAEREANKLQERRAYLENIALNGGPTGDMSPSEFGRAKRQQQMAAHLLGQLDAAQHNKAALAMQGRHADIAERKAQNAEDIANLKFAIEQAREERKEKQGEKANELAEKRLAETQAQNKFLQENTPRKWTTSMGTPISGTRADLEAANASERNAFIEAKTKKDKGLFTSEAEARAGAEKAWQDKYGTAYQQTAKEVRQGPDGKLYTKNENGEVVPYGG